MEYNHDDMFCKGIACSVYLDALRVNCFSNMDHLYIVLLDIRRVKVKMKALMKWMRILNKSRSMSLSMKYR